jgi:hypothetical protein
VRAEDLDEKFPVVKIDSDALDAVRLLAEHRLNGLVVVTDTSETPFAVLPASQVVRFIVPGYVQDDPGLASVMTESMADHAAEKLAGRTIRDMLPKQRQHIPVARGHGAAEESAGRCRQRRQVTRGDHRIAPAGRGFEGVIGRRQRVNSATHSM